MHHQYDKSSKWLIQHYGDSILRLAGVRDFVAWRPLAAELVQSRRLPDGLIEVRRQGQTEQDLYILEIATYPEARVAAQAACDAALVYLDRGVLPEVVVLFLHPRGNIKAASTVNLRSRQGLTHWRLSWKIAKLWEVPALELLGAATSVSSPGCRSPSSTGRPSRSSACAAPGSIKTRRPASTKTYWP